MTTLTLTGGTLLAADQAGRTVTYRLVPYGEPGRTNLGLVTIAPGVLHASDATGLVLNHQHDPDRPYARGAVLDDTATELRATWTLPPTRAADDLLAEIAAGLRTGASVELADVTITDGAVTAARVVGAAAVVAPAFPSAGALLVAADTETAPIPELEKTDHDDGGTTTVPPATDQEEPAMTDTAAPAPTLTASAAPVPYTAPTPPDRGPSLAHVAQLLAQLNSSGRTAELVAALSDVKVTGNGQTFAPQWIGEAWSGVPYERQITPLINQAQLTGPTVTGWQWSTKPAGAAYAGDKAAVPSNAAATAAVTWAAERFAGAHDIDRAWVDFGVAGFWESYWAAMGASYSAWADARCAAALVAGATVVTTLGTGVVNAILAGSLAILPYGGATFALLDAASYAKLTAVNPLAFLAGSLNLTDGSGTVGALAFRVSAALAANTVLVGNRNSATFYELGGGAPIRAEALDLVKGGADVGAFGYAVTGVHAPAALAKVTVT